MKKRKKGNKLIISLLLITALLTEGGMGVVRAAELNPEVSKTENIANDSEEDTDDESDTSAGTDADSEEENEDDTDVINKGGTVSGAVPLKKDELLLKKSEDLLEKEGIEYVLGRPMTEEEEEEQRKIMHSYIANLPSLEPDKAVQSVISDEEDMVRATALPSSYDSRNNGYITSVKNQNPYGVCWSFSSINMAESSLVKKNLMSLSDADLSEYHLAYYTYRFVTDPLGGTAGDSNYKSSVNNILDDGGNYNRAKNTLSSWIGVVRESEAPYGMAPSNLPETTEAAYGKNVAVLRNALEINKSDASLVKKAIMDYGSVGIMYFATDNPSYYQINTASQYCSDASLGVNHAVSIVGWNDNYSVNNFASKPSNNGAWLVKNSWGSVWGKSGYFWLSYEDATINSTVFAFDMDKAGQYDNNYQYDGAGADRYIGLNNTFEFANVFTAHANTGKKEILKAVSFATDTANTNYSVQVYLNPKNSSDPTSGTAMLGTPQTGSLTYEGYYSIDLAQPVELMYGDVFAVVVTLSKSGSAVYAGCEGSGNGSTASALAGQSFYKLGSRWVDIGQEDNLNMRVKAFTVNTNITGQTTPVTGITMPETEGQMELNTTKQIVASVVPTNATNKTINWSSSDPSVATVDSNGKVTAVKLGNTVITATTAEGNYTAQYRLQVKEKSIYTDLRLRGVQRITYVGTSYQFTATVIPENAPDTTVSWNTSNANIVDVDTNGLVTAMGIGTATITATANGDKDLKVSVDVTVPDNNYNRVRSFVNRMYTVALNRKPDNNGATYWTNQLLTGAKDGAAVAKGFVLSPEMERRNLSDSQYIDMLYKTFFDRSADANGKAFWLNLLKNGVSRAYVFKGFCHSQEFSNICNNYGIKRGTITLTENRDQNHNITMYVFRCYDRTLERKPDTKGLNFWTGQILDKKRSPEDVAGNFVFSTEFKNKNLSDEEYVKVLYRMFFDREYNAPGTDPNGIKFWLNELKSGRRDRYKVFKDFANSQEFKNVLDSFGL